MVRNKFDRVLIVIGNNIISLVAVPISILAGICYVVYENVRYDLEIDFKETVGWIIDGLKQSHTDNIEFIKTGDLHVFRINK